MRGRIPYRTALVMSAALSSASLGAGYPAPAGIDDGAGLDDTTGIDNGAGIGGGMDPGAAIDDSAREHRGWDGLGSGTSGFWDRTEEPEHPAEHLGYGGDLGYQVEFEDTVSYWHWPLS